MLAFLSMELGRSLAICETHAILSRKTRIVRLFARRYDAAALLHAAIEEGVLGGLRLRQAFDARLGLRLMPHQHEQPDAIFQFPKSAPKREFLIDGIAVGFDGIRDAPSRDKRMPGEVLRQRTDVLSDDDNEIHSGRRWRHEIAQAFLSEA